jgi:signal transduction histidine kinase
MADISRLIEAHLFDQAPFMVAVFDSKLRILKANASFEKTFGPWQGRTCYELFKGATSACELCLASVTLADGKTRVCDDQLKSLGSYGHFVVRVAVLQGDKEPDGPFLLWMASNVNEAQSLQQENDILFERMPCYVTILDREFRVVRANRRMKETFGPSVGKRCYEAYKRRDRPCRVCPVAQVFADGKEHSSTMAGISASGEETHYAVTASPLSWEQASEGRRPKFVIEMATDITSLRRLEQEKLEAERLAAVGQTVAGLAHGIKNVLMGLEGGVYVMNSGIRQNQMEKVQRGSQMLTRNVEKISSLVKNLLSFSKGRVPVVQMADLNAIAREVLELYKAAGAQAGITIEGSFAANIEPAPLDAEGIHTCIANLVSNAIDACQVSDRKGKTVHIETREQDGALILEVRDDGVGMDYEVKKKLFTTFFTTKGAGGTGLGLLLTRKIVQEHGGIIEVDSEPGKGTTFRVILSRERLPKVTLAVPANELSGGGDLGREQ